MITRRMFLGGVILMPALVALNISPLKAETPKPISALNKIKNKRVIQKIMDDLGIIHEQSMGEINDSHTRESITSLCEQRLYTYKHDGLLYDFAVRCDESNNTPETIDANKLRTDVAIKLTKASDFIYIPITVAPSTLQGTEI